jgi:DNA-binding CsgD family transcriptional regulator
MMQSFRGAGSLPRMRASLDADPTLAMRTLDLIDLALLVVHRAGRVVLANDRGETLLRSLGGTLDRVPASIASLLEEPRATVEVKAAGARHWLTAAPLDGEDLVLVTAVEAAPLGLGAYGLSPREREIAELAGRGLSNEEISRAAGITVGTVKQYLNRIFVAMGLTRRAQLIVRLHEARSP